MKDSQLLYEYVKHDSQQAFAQLVERHLNLVYTTCLRELGDAALAEDTTQVVFLLLARKAKTLPPTVVLAGWLFKVSRYAARNARRAEERRQKTQLAAEVWMRDEEYAAAPGDELWPQIEPLLHEGLLRLSETERNAVLLRFYEERSHKEIGAALGLSEEAARKRVTRALEKLRAFLSRRGVMLSLALLSGQLSRHAVQAAPASCLQLAQAIPQAASLPAVTANSVAALHQTLGHATLFGHLKGAALFIGAAVAVTGTVQRMSPQVEAAPVALSASIETRSATFPAHRRTSPDRAEIIAKRVNRPVPIQPRGVPERAMALSIAAPENKRRRPSGQSKAAVPAQPTKTTAAVRQKASPARLAAAPKVNAPGAGVATLTVSVGGALPSLSAARDAIRTLKAQGAINGPVRVIITEGVYSLTEPVTFTPQDSGTPATPISYEAAPGAQPIFSGGRRLAGWKKGADGVWQMDAGPQPFEQLWVNGVRAVRARTPNDGFFSPAGPAPEIVGAPFPVEPADKNAFRAKSEDVADLKAMTPAERQNVDVTVVHLWEGTRHRVQALGNNGVLYLTLPKNKSLFLWEAPRYRLENYRAALDAPGEWFRERSGTVFYKPRPGEDMTTAEIVAPVADKFLVFAGDNSKGAFVENLTFKGLRFRYAGRELPPNGEGNSQAAAGLNAAVLADGARRLTFENCEFAHVDQYALWLRRGCSNNRVAQCHIHDLGGGGLRLGESTKPTQPNNRSDGNIVDNNIVQHGGRVFPGAVGLWVGQSGGNRITHNDVGDFFNSGISVGWTWSYDETLHTDNLIEFNRVHHIGQGVLSDFGGIYTLGRSEGTRIANNVIHDVTARTYGGWGLFADECSSFITYENNLIYRVKSGGYGQNKGRENLVRNNVFAGNTGKMVRRARVEPHLSFTLRGNVFCFEDGALWDGEWADKNVIIENNLTCRISADGKMPVTKTPVPDGAFERAFTVADPLFEDAANGDFRFKADSPALKRGFVPFDYSAAGVYGDEAWKKRAAMPAPQP